MDRLGSDAGGGRAGCGGVWFVVVVFVSGFVGVGRVDGAGGDGDVDHVRVPSAVDGSGGAGVFG
ncbi:MAG TPA: hypothetical protein VFI54_28170, partial [Solirubrobacteraceae bacterium]|nr:hypothetical protein [Solirubrobacteraceae bacterium]